MRSDRDVSIRRVCRVFLVDTSTYHYKSRRPGQAALEQRIREICQTRVRYGYRHVHVLLRREGCCHGQNKTRRIYRELGLQLRNKTPKRRVKAKLRDDRRPATRSNETWAMDFLHDQLATGRKLRVLTIVDMYSPLSPALEPRFARYGCSGPSMSGRQNRGRELHRPSAGDDPQGCALRNRNRRKAAPAQPVVPSSSRPPVDSPTRMESRLCAAHKQVFFISIDRLQYALDSGALVVISHNKSNHEICTPQKVRCGQFRV